MDLFLARFILETRRYMVDRSEETVEMRLVRAIDEQEAVKKVEQEYEKKSSDYGVTYWVKSIEIIPTIS